MLKKMPIILTILLFNSPLAGISQDGGEDGIEGVTSDYSVALDYVKGELSDAYTRLHVIPGLPSERLEKKYILDIDTCMDFFSSQGAEPLYQKLLLEAAMYVTCSPKSPRFSVRSVQVLILY